MNSVIVWQRTLWQKLMREDGLRSHALLLKGREGIGKLTFARLLIKSILCNKPTVEGVACGNCASCNWFEQKTHPNFFMISTEAFLAVQTQSSSYEDQIQTDNKANKTSSQQIGIGQIRELDDFVYLSGHQSSHKIILIYPAEAMNKAASNALLKKLEEPPEQVLFILISHQPQRLLPTIKSRCQQIAMPVPERQTALQWLAQQIKERRALEQRANDDIDNNEIEKLQAVLALSSLAPFKALRFEESYDQHRQFVAGLSKPESFDPLNEADRLKNQDLTMIIDWMQKWCYDLLCLGACDSIRYHPHCETNIRSIAKRINLQKLLDYQQFLNTQQSLANHPLQARLFLEAMLIKYHVLFAPQNRFVANQQ